MAIFVKLILLSNSESNRISNSFSVMIISTSPLRDLCSGLKDYRRLSTDGFSSKLINVLIFGSGLDLCSLLKLHSIVDQKCKIFGLVFLV